MPKRVFSTSPGSGTLTALCLLATVACQDASEPSEAPVPAATAARLIRDIVFVSTRDGNREIYSMASDGNQETNLSNNPADESDPSWSPDAKTIVFVRAVTGGSEIWLMDASGANQRRVSLAVRGTPPYATSPRWSPDGSRIAFLRSTTSGAAGDMYIVGIGGGLEKKVTSGGGVLNAAAWAPSSAQLAFVRSAPGGELLFRVNADGSGLAQLAGANNPSLPPLAGPERGPEPCWAPGLRILYTDTYEPFSSELLSIDPAGGTPLRLTTYAQNGYDGVMGGCWSPNDARITASVFFMDQLDVVAMNPNGSGKVNLTDIPGGFACLSRGFSHAMDKVLYYRNEVPWETGSYQIWTMKPDGTDKRQLTTFGSNTDPAWQL